MKKIVGILLALCLLLSGAVFAEEAALTKDIVVLYTSDVHCGVEQGFGYAGLYAIRSYLEETCHVILVDNGDSIQGEAMGTITEGEASINLMNALDYDLAIPGNHEFDYGMERFWELVEMADHTYLSANFNKNGELVLAPYAIREFDGVKVGFVGLTTPKTITSSAPKYFQNDTGEYIYGFMQDESGEAFYSAAQSAVDAARSEGADYIVVMCHLGNEADCQPWTYSDLIENTTGIDAVLDGHSHDADQIEMLNKDGETVLRSACGTKLSNVGYLRIAADGTLSTGLFNWTNEVSAPELLGIENEGSAAVTEATSELNKKLSEVVARTDVDLEIYDPVAVNEDGSPVRIIRCAETNLGNLCSDAYRILSGAEISFVNGGGIRATINAGDITMGDIYAVHPFGNSLCVVEITGQQLLDALEMATEAVPGSKGGFLHVSGITFELHTYLPSSVEVDETGMFVGVSGEYRVKNVMVNGEPLDLEKTYTAASTNYTVKSFGDGMAMFEGCKVLQDEIMLDNQVLINYIVDYLGGVIGEEYADPYGEGRMTVVEDSPLN